MGKSETKHTSHLYEIMKTSAALITQYSMTVVHVPFLPTIK